MKQKQNHQCLVAKRTIPQILQFSLEISRVPILQEQIEYLRICKHIWRHYIKKTDCYDHWKSLSQIFIGAATKVCMET